MKKIRIHPTLKKKIMHEFNVSIQTVNMSLRYVFSSRRAKQIRQRAKELLLLEVENIEKQEINN